MKKLLQNNIIRFLIIAAGLYITWLFLYFYFIKQHTIWDEELNFFIASNAHDVLNWFDVVTLIERESDQVLILMGHYPYDGVRIGDSCNGFKIFSIFSIFIFAFPGPWKSKAWFIPMGLVIVHIANVIRVVLLLLINNYYHEYMDFNHLYTFTIFVYGIIFLLWYWYAKKFSAYAKKA